MKSHPSITNTGVLEYLIEAVLPFIQTFFSHSFDHLELKSDEIGVSRKILESLLVSDLHEKLSFLHLHVS